MSEWRIGRPPVPNEHGTWFMLFVPLLLPLLAGPATSFAPAVLLIVAAAGAFMGQYVIRLMIRQRRKQGTVFWLAVYLAALASAAGALIGVYGLWDLPIVGGAAGGLFGLYTLLRRTLRRFDRSQGGELLAVGTLALAAPAGYVVAYGALDRYAWLVWIACVLYFTSGVFYVNMLIAAGKVKQGFDRQARWRAGRGVLFYHILLVVVLASVIVLDNTPDRWLFGLAYAPAIIRAFRGWVTLSNVLPPLTKVGLKEAAYSVWFLAVCALAWGG